jgi:SAM-dependent methyltransferase
LAFEDRFRGGSEEISQRLSVYLPYVSQTPAGDEPVIDIGCGRGEWLELLREAGYTAIGVDSDPAMVQHATQRGLKIVEEDGLSYLRTLDDNSVRAISAFHILEHVPFGITLQLLKEIVRVLRPGGVALLETPNPHNILVGACHFYNDPTHLRPIPSELLSFAAEYCGLAAPSILFLHRAADSHWIREEGDTIEHRFNDLFYGPQDYSLIAYKAE